jgi:hypothetical protein
MLACQLPEVGSTYIFVIPTRSYIAAIAAEKRNILDTFMRVVISVHKAKRPTIIWRGVLLYKESDDDLLLLWPPRWGLTFKGEC